MTKIATEMATVAVSPHSGIPSNNIIRPHLALPIIGINAIEPMLVNASIV